MQIGIVRVEKESNEMRIELVLSVCSDERVHREKGILL